MKLLEMSISAGVLVFVLILLRTFGSSKLPRRVFILCWMIVLARLFLPVSLPFQKGIASPAVGLLQQVMRLAGQKGNIGNKDMTAKITEAASCGIADTTGDRWLDMDVNADVSMVLCCLWLAGAVVCGIYFLYSFWREQNFLSEAIPLEYMPKSWNVQKANDRPGKYEHFQELYASVRRVVGIRTKAGKKEALLTHDRLASPLVRGIISQQIVIPKEMLHIEESQMKYILAHEMVHIRRWDNFRKFISAAAVCIHWFNPAVWAMYFLLARDLELSCDERVLALYGKENRESYAMTLLTLAQNQKETLLFSSGFGKNPTRERIVAIMKYRKLSKFGSVCAVMMLVGAVTIFAANDEASASEGQPEQAQTEADLNPEINVDDQADDKDMHLTAEDHVSYALMEVPEDGSEAKILKSGERKGNNEDELRKAAKEADDEAEQEIRLMPGIVETDSESGMNMELVITQDGESKEAVSEKYYFIGEDGEEKPIDLSEGENRLTVDGKRYSIDLTKDGNRVNVKVKDEK